jgi:para-aminobenzoate synthetase component 1
MRPLLVEVATAVSPEMLAQRLQGERGLVLLRTRTFDFPHARYSLVAARPFAALRSHGSRCEVRIGDETQVHFGNPWHVLDGLMARCELLDEVDLPFPLGGCFGFWGYDLKNFVEPRLRRQAVNDLELPECHVGFHDSLVVFDHGLGKTWLVSTGLCPDGSRDPRRAQEQLDWWRARLEEPTDEERLEPETRSSTGHRRAVPATQADPPESGTGNATGTGIGAPPPGVTSNFSRTQFVSVVERAQRYIRAGDIYQVNLAQRLVAPDSVGSWRFYQRLADLSPAPFSAYLDCGGFALSSSSPEMFIRLSGSQIITRPIKGTRPRSADPVRDAQLTYELQTSGKEMAELVMITDLLRNDLGRVCEYGTVHVPELVRLERYAQVQHLVSTIEGRLRQGVTHFDAFARCFPGGSITGAPKIRAMEIIDELEPVTRGPYTGCIGYLGFNRESQLSIAIRTAVHRGGQVYFHAGAGIVADSIPEAEYDETLAKAAGFLSASGWPTANRTVDQGRRQER